MGTLINSGKLLRWSDDISLLNQEQGYMVPFLSIIVDYKMISSYLNKTTGIKFYFFVDYSTNNRNRQNRIIINFYFVDYSNNNFFSILGL